MSAAWTAAWLVATVVALAGCGSTTETVGRGGAGGASSAGGSGGVGVGGADGGSAPAGCPAMAPETGLACSLDDLACTYGDDLQPGCRDRFVCMGGSWTDPPSVQPCVEPSTTDCSDSAPASFEVCAPTPVDTYCEYPSSSTVCRCVDEDCAGACQILDPPEWRCYGAPETDGCPAVAPNAGTPCAAPGLACYYLGGGCSTGGINVECQAGTWRWLDAVECPV